MAGLVLAGIMLHARAGGAPERAPLDPDSAVAELRRAYHKRAFVEAMEITVEDAGTRRRESVIVRANVKGELRLELGELRVWTDGAVLRAVHRLNAGTFYEAALDEKDRAGSFLAALPPLAVPQVGLVLQPRDAKATAWRPGPVCADLVWESAVAASHVRKPAVVLSGAGAGCSARVAAVGVSPVLTFAEMKAERDGVTTTVTARIERVDEPAGRLEADLRGRERVAALSDLRAMAPDVRAGLVMPELIGEPVERSGERAGPLVPVGRACVLVIFDATREGGGAGEEALSDEKEIGEFLRAMRGAAGRGGEGVSFRMLAAASLTRAGARGGAVALMKSVAPGAGFVSFSPGTTLGRFVAWSAEAGAEAGDGEGATRGVAVVIDRSGLVIAVVPMGDEGVVRDVAAALERAR